MTRSSIDLVVDAFQQSQQMDYKPLADFRHSLRRFLRYSKEALRTASITPDQYQAMLAIKTFNAGKPISVTDLAQELQIKHHSTVGLVYLLVSQKLVERRSDPKDRRRVLLRLTELGEMKLAELAPLHRAELLRLRAGLMSAPTRLGD